MNSKWGMKVVAAMALIVGLTSAAAVRANLSSQSPNQDIVDTAESAGKFKTLAAALKAAGLIDTLKAKGPFTVFAPTDEAFAALPAGTVEDLLKPENRAKLTATLTYHVVPGRIPAEEVINLAAAKTVGGQRIDFKVTGGKVSVDGATVVQADIAATNGIIHVIDRVILPSSDDIVATAKTAGKFNTLLRAAEAAGLVEALRGDGPLTVFAPTDDAFAKLPAGTVEGLLKPENRSQLATVLKYHVVAGRAFAEDAIAARSVKTLTDDSLRFRLANGRLQVNDANVIAADIDASNGVVHVIDAVLLPPKRAQMQPMNPIDSSTATDLITYAIERGVPQFNHGNHAACVAIYEVAAQGVIGMSDRVPAGVRKHLMTALRNAERQDNMTDRAWTLRRGLDAAIETLGEDRMSKVPAGSMSAAR